ncbi:MAG: hypothetical protein KGH78_00320 [Candidatus Micrarchaeota archaeon]|nr:hypothetical protein [Candidatus Micrarchaeota archaeon]MDE1846458.1 hypothetical protein [Candidatus Micrarchaeota archaeon]
MTNTICISLGGSSILGKRGIIPDNLEHFASALSRSEKSDKFVVVVGGGAASRQYISSSTKLLGNDRDLDEVGIAVTRVNALIVMKYLSKKISTFPKVLQTLEELPGALRGHRVAVMGGLRPGISTDAVAALACKKLRSKLLVNVSAVMYVYNKKPTAKGARAIHSLDHQTMLRIARRFDNRKPGTHFIFDLEASKIAKRENIEVRFSNLDEKNLILTIKGSNFRGSVVRSR